MDNPIVPLILLVVIGLPIGGLLWWLLRKVEDGGSKSKTVSQFYSNRWMTKSEMNTKYIFTTAARLKEKKQTGALVRFEATGTNLEINMNPKDYHCIVLGTTGSGKTQGYVLPFVYTLGHSGVKPNMVITDPKGEIYGHMAETLRRQGYDVQVFNLTEPSKSSRWNPFDHVWDMYMRAHNLDKEMKKHTNVDPKNMSLRIIASSYPNEWYEFNKIAFPSYSEADLQKKILKQRLLNEAEADVKDICAAICPSLSEKDKSWEDGARDLIQGTALAMLEDGLNPQTGMTKEKFNFYNIFKMLSLRDSDPQAPFATIKNYFEGRNPLSPAIALAGPVISNADVTMKNFFGVVTNKLSMFADKGVCYITSGTDIDFANFAKKPTAFFLIIPDQIKIRHVLATLCVSQLYKSLVNTANSLGGKLPWPTYFILDEFGNMPKFENFETIVTVSRSRGIFLTLVLQDYKQLSTTYGDNAAVTIRNNCNIQIFIGVNDMDTRKMFSDLLGEMSIETENKSTSKTTGKAAKDDSDAGSKSTSYQTVSRPLLPPNELLDMKEGQIFVYCFGFNPLRSKVTLFYKCVQARLVAIYKEPEKFVQGNYFDEEKIYYDIRKRNDAVLKGGRKDDIFDW